MSRPTSALEREYTPGTTVFREKAAGACMYVIRSGRVKIFRRLRDSEIVLAFLGPGDFFGEMALLEGLPRSATAVVVEPTVLIEVDGNTFEEMIRRNIEIAVRIMRRLASRVRELDERLGKLLVEDAVSRVLEVLRWLLPQGNDEGYWVRLPAAISHLDIATQAGIPPVQAESVLARLESANCLRTKGGELLIAKQEKLDAFASYLDHKRRYDHLFAEEAADSDTPHGPSFEMAMERLVKTLQLSPADLERNRQALAKQYTRYSELRQRFKEMDKDGV